MLSNVTVIDGTGADPRPGMTIVIEDGRIQELFPTAERQPPAGARTLDMTGRFVIPGLINTHVHFTPLLLRGQPAAAAELRRMLYGGVTGARDVAGNAQLLAKLEQSIASGGIAGPDLYYAAVFASPDFMRLDPRIGARAAAGIAPDDPAYPVTVTSQTAVVPTIERVARSGATGLKFYVGVDAPMIGALTAEAHRHGLRSWSHSTVFPDRPIEVVRAGVDVLSHVCFLPWQDRDLDPSKNIPYTHTPADAPIPVFDPAGVQADAPEMTSLFAEMARRGTVLDATASFRTVRTPLNTGCTDSLRVALATAAHRAGVSISMGTDYFAPPDDPYPSVFREIEYLVNHAVLTPMEALTAGTRNGALVLGTDSVGTVARDKVANLVVLEADPSRDIRAMRGIVMVLKRGVVYPRSEYAPARVP